MSLPISQECWDDNMRLYHEMTKGSAPRPQEDSIPPTIIRTSSGIAQFPTPTPLTISGPGIKKPEGQPATYPGNSRAPPPAPRSVFPGDRMRHTIEQQRSRAPGEQSRIVAPPSHAPDAPMALPPTITGYSNLTQPNEQIAYHVNDHTYWKPYPDYLSFNLPSGSQLRDPARTAQLLQLISPQLNFVEYSCGCRNSGSCTHYQFVFDRSKLPDGLICDGCQNEKRLQRIPQTAAKGKRKCPKHHDDTGREKNHFRSSLEDFLPTPEQHRRYHELLERHRTGNWGSVARVSDQTTERRIAEPVSRREAPSTHLETHAKTMRSKPKSNDLPLANVFSDAHHVSQMPPMQGMRTMTDRPTNLSPLINISRVPPHPSRTYSGLAGQPRDGCGSQVPPVREVRNILGPSASQPPLTDVPKPHECSGGESSKPQLAVQNIAADPGSGPAVQRAAIRPLPEVTDQDPDFSMLPPSAWATSASGSATVPAQSANQSFFTPGRAGEDFVRQLYGPNTDSFDTSGVPSGQQSGIQESGAGVGGASRAEEVGRGGKYENVKCVDLTSFEQGALYNLDLETFLGSSGLGERSA